jgi:hypothetical protein
MRQNKSRSTWGKFGRDYYSWYVEDMVLLETFIIDHNIDVDYWHRSFGYTSTLKYQVGRFTDYPSSRCVAMVITLFEPIHASRRRDPGEHHYTCIYPAIIV